MKRSYAVISLCIIFVTGLISLWAAQYLPENVPMHWNYNGQVDHWGPRLEMLTLIPGCMVGIFVLLLILPKISPQKFEVEAYERTYNYLSVLILALMAYLHLYTLWAIHSGNNDLPRTLLVGLTIFMALTGNVMGKVKRNFWMGIRTPWTLASEQVWYETHRLAGKLMVGGSVLALIAALADAPVWLTIGLMLGGPIIAAGYSLVYYRRFQASH